MPTEVGAASMHQTNNTQSSLNVPSSLNISTTTSGGSPSSNNTTSNNNLSSSTANSTKSNPINMQMRMNENHNSVRPNSLEKSSGLSIVNSYKERKYKIFNKEKPETITLNPSTMGNSDGTSSSPSNRTSRCSSSGSNNNRNSLSSNSTFEPSSSTFHHNVNRNNITVDSIPSSHRSQSVYSTKAPYEQQLHTLSPSSPTDLTPIQKTRSNSFDAASGETGPLISVEDTSSGKQEETTSRRGSRTIHQREKFQLSGEQLWRKPSPKRSHSEDAEKDTNAMINSVHHDDLPEVDDALKGSHFHVQSLPSRSSGQPTKKPFPTNWITANNSSNNKFKGIGNPEYVNTANPAHAIKHTFKEIRKNIKDEVKKGVHTVKNAPSFIMSVPKKIMPSFQVPQKEHLNSMSIDIDLDFEMPEQKRQAIGELYVTDIQTRNLKSVEGYMNEPSTLSVNSAVTNSLTASKRVKSLQGLDTIVSPRNSLNGEPSENTLYEEYVTYCEVLCEGKKHTTMPLGGAYLNKKLKWQEEFKFYISDESSSISVEIFHCSPKPKSKNDLICLGFISIPLSRVKLTKDRILDDWFSLITPLGNKTYSQVHLRFQYIPYQNPILSAKDLELLDGMSLQPNIPELTPREKPNHRALLDSLNIDVSDDLLVNKVYTSDCTTTDATDLSQSGFMPMRSFGLYEGLWNGKDQSNTAILKVKDDLQLTEKTLQNEIHILKLDLIDTKKKVNDAHEQSRMQLSNKGATIEKLKNKIEKMESRMNHLSTIVLQLNSAQAITKDKVTSHEEDIKLYESRLKELESKVNTMYSQKISTKVKEWVFYLLAFLLFFFSQFLVLTGFIFNRIRLRRPPSDEVDNLDYDEDEENTFNILRKRMEGAEKKYRDMANTPQGKMPVSSPTTPTSAPKETFFSQLTKVAAMLPFKKTTDVPTIVEKPTQILSFSTLERQIELKELISKTEEDSSENEDKTSPMPPLNNINDNNTRKPKQTFLRDLSDSSSDEEDRKPAIMDRSTSTKIFEDISTTVNNVPETSISKDEHEHAMKVANVVPEHQQSYLFNQLKQSFNDEEEIVSPQSIDAAASPLANVNFDNLVTNNQQSMIEEAEKLQSISQFFRKSDTGSLKKKKSSNNVIQKNTTSQPPNKQSHGEDDDFDSWFNDKVN